MDWSRAKTILIISFLILNLVLGYSVANKKPDIDENIIVEDRLIVKTKDLLEEKNIKLNTNIPNEVIGLPSLNVKYEKIDKDKLNQIFFNGEGSIEEYKEDESSITKISKGEEYIKNIGDKILVYENKTRDKKISIKTKEEAKREVENFLIDRDINLNDMKLSFIDRKNNTYTLVYSKVHKGYYIEDTRTKIILGEYGVERMERSWYNVISEGDNNIYMEPAPKSLLSLLTIQDAFDKTITDISICYYFNIDNYQEIGEDINIYQGKAVPTWRVQFEDGEKIIIDNF